MRNRIPFLLPVVIAAGCLGNGSAEKSTENRPVEYQLAIIHAGGYVSENDITVARFRSLLNQLSTTYVENRQQIADMSVGAQQLLRREGIKMNLLDLMEGMNQLFTGSTGDPKYSECVAIYCTLRTKGKSHPEAIETIQSLLQAVGGA